jgi:hypothetical protein
MGDVMTLALIPIQEVGKCPPAIFHELAAAKYLGMCRPKFRELVFAGIIPWTTHLNGKTRIYLKEDLDCYTGSLKRCTMTPRENSPRPALKGVKSK